MESPVVGAKFHFFVGEVLITDESHDSIASESLCTLTDEADISPDCDSPYEEQIMSVQESPTNPVVEGDMEEKTRQCLVCRSPFPSTWAGERICRGCKSKATWRSGVRG